MHRTSASILRSITLFAVILTSSSAFALTLGSTEIELISVNPNQSVTPSGLGHATPAGQFNWTNNGPLPFPPASFASYCIELTQTVGYSPQTNIYDLETINSPALLELVNYAEDQGVIDTSGVSAGSVSAAAFQMAVWEVVYEGTVTSPRSIDDGNFTVSGGSTAARDLANDLLEFSVGYDTSEVSIFALTNPNKQDQLVIVARSDAPPVPEPSSVLGWTAIAFGMMVFARKRSRR